MPKVVMGCGHISSSLWTSEDGEKIPVCADCLRNNPKKAKEVVTLRGRIARCRSCGKPQSSSTALFDFKFNPTGEIDSYYDGCVGW